MYSTDDQPLPSEGGKPTVIKISFTGENGGVKVVSGLFVFLIVFEGIFRFELLVIC
jgi:hypothetical protein